VFLAVLLVLAAGVGGLLWWRWSRALPRDRAADFLAHSPALELPSRPQGVVVLTHPGAWVRFLQRNQFRAILLDPSWWRSFETGEPQRGFSAGPVPATALLLDQLRHGLVFAWWRDAWVVQAVVPGGRATRKLAEPLSRRFAGRWRLEGNVLRIASNAALLEGRDWKLRPEIEPDQRLACWIWWDGTQWPGHWEDDRLVLERGHAGTKRLPEARGALLAHLGDGRRLLDLLGSRLPSKGILEGAGKALEGLLSRPVGLWLRRLEVGNALPRPLAAVELDLLDGENAEEVTEALHDLLCPFGCTTEEGVLSDGRPVAHWQSPMGSWWIFVVPGDAVVASTSRGQLETFLGARAAWPGGDWAVAGGDAAASSLRTLASARLLAVFGLVRSDQLERLRRLADPIRGFSTFRWIGGPRGDRIEIVPAPAD